MSKDLVELVTGVLSRAPEWVRANLAVKDEIVRRRAEETLAAMIAAALQEASWLLVMVRAEPRSSSSSVSARLT